MIALTIDVIDLPPQGVIAKNATEVAHQMVVTERKFITSHLSTQLMPTVLLHPPTPA
jgi:hypothetical protein